MSDIRTETVPLVDGSSLRLTVGEPEGAVRGGIVVLHEARGVTDAVRDLVNGLADDGWLAVAPHLYHRDGADELDGDEAAVREQLERLDSDQVLADTDTAFGWLGDHDIDADRMGVIGFDLGGSVALVVAAKRTLGAAVSVGDMSGPGAPSERITASLPLSTSPKTTSADPCATSTRPSLSKNRTPAAARTRTRLAM